VVPPCLIEALVGSASPILPDQGSSYVHWTTSLPRLYIRNIIPIRAPTGLSRVQSKPLPGRDADDTSPEMSQPDSGALISEMRDRLRYVEGQLEAER
jgi:hypothetical protein